MNEQQTQQADDPSGEGWRDVEVGEILQSGDMLSDGTTFVHTDAAGSRCTWQGVYRRRIEPQPEAQPQTQQADDPSGPGWRDVGPDELLQEGDVYPIGERWEPTASVGAKARVCGNGYRRRIEQQQPKSEPEPQPNPDDPSGPGWRDVIAGEILQPGDMMLDDSVEWRATRGAGKPSLSGLRYRRRIEQQQPSGSEPETMEDLRRRLDEYAVLLDEAERGGKLVNAELQQLRERVQNLTRQVQFDAVELQQLREQVQTLTRELRAERDSGMIALRSQNRLGQEALAEALQTWLRPVIELVAEHPEDCSSLAVAVLGYLPGIASRLIEE